MTEIRMLCTFFFIKLGIMGGSCRNGHIVVCYKRIVPRNYLYLEETKRRLAYHVDLMADRCFMCNLLCHNRCLFGTVYFLFHYLAFVGSLLHLIRCRLGCLFKAKGQGTLMDSSICCHYMLYRYLGIYHRGDISFYRSCCPGYVKA